MVWGFNKILISSFVTCFFAGILIGILWASMNPIGSEMPLSMNILSPVSTELVSPSDHITESDIHVFSDKIIIDIDNASWASFTDTNSMDPFIDAGSNSIEILPQSEDDIQVGDVISFRTGFSAGLIIHRVVEVGEDSKGKYYITKGDNNELKDPGKRRFDDIAGVVVAVIY
ncbi:signal peptidase I [Thermoproteota archaeon]